MTDTTMNGQAAHQLLPPTVQNLAQLKHLPVEFLRGLGLSDLPKGCAGIPYYDPSGGEPLFTRERRALQGSRRFYQPKGVSLQPYGLWRLEKAYKEGFLIIVEGESDCWALWYHDFPCLGLPGSSSAKTLKGEYIDSIERIYVCREPDQGGEAFIKGVTIQLRKLRFAGKAYELRLLERVKDPSDLHVQNPEQFDAIIKAAMDSSARIGLLPPHRPDGQASGSADRNGSPTRERPPTQSELLLTLAESAEYFHTPDERAFATVTVEGDERGLETVPVRGEGFRHWLRYQYFLATGKAPSMKTLYDIIGTLEARACFAGARCDVFCRVGGNDGNIYLNLCDEKRRAVAITPEGWRLMDRVPVRFRRTRGMLPLPEPMRGGTIEELRRFVNVSDEHWPLLIGWLVQSFRPQGSFPVLCLHGEQGAAKSTTARVLRSLVDPNIAPLRAVPRDERELIIGANNTWVMALDNLSHLEPWLSDALCRLATGGGFTTRALYTDAEEIIFDVQRPILLTGIEDLASRPDLMDRSIVLHLPAIKEDKRLPEEVFWQRFETARPCILGALLDAASGALRHISDIHLERLPRMADFARWATAAMRVLGWPEGAFIEAYQINRAEGCDLTLEASVIYPFLQQLIRQSTNTWSGTCRRLLDQLTQLAGDQVKLKRWPSTPRALSGMLRRLAPSLRGCGIRVDFVRQHGGGRDRLVRIEAEH